MKKIAMLLSGGVDSSLAAYLLKKAGYCVTGIYLKIWLEDELSFLGECPWQQDLAYVEKLSTQLNMPIEIINLQREYKNSIVSHTIEQVKAGYTPNPDILCNKYIKFGVAWKKLAHRFDAIATGHYAQVIHGSNGIPQLHCAPDQVKDQTYFLSYLTHEQLKHCIFPIGHLTKAQVRAQANALNLPTSRRKDSQGICFLGKIKFTDFLRQYLGTKTGQLIEFESGKPLGTHDGFWYYTIGQRRGIGISGGPWYVVTKNTYNNTVYVSRSYFDTAKERRKLIIKNINWLGTRDSIVQNLTVKLRHGMIQYQAKASFLPNERLHITLDSNDQGIAPGQFAVLYRNTQCVASGLIEKNDCIE